MALRVGHVGRLRSSSRGLNPDEQTTDAAALIRDLFCHTGTSCLDDAARLSEIAEKLRLHLGSHAAAQDTFRRGGGFERILEIFTLLESAQNELSHDDDGRFAALTRLVGRLLALLSEALRDHRGNERYFRNHVDGWNALSRTFTAIQAQLCRNANSEKVANRCASLYNLLLAFALGLDECKHFNASLDESNSAGTQNGVETLSSLKQAAIRHPEVCANLITLALQSPAELGSAETNPLLLLSSHLFRSLTELVDSSTRNNVAVRQTSAASDVLSAAFDPKTPENWKAHLQKLLLCLGRYGLNDVDDAALLFKRGAESVCAREALLSLLQSSKEPSSVQFDLLHHGFSSIEVARLPGLFPPPVGYTFSAWLRIDEFDAKSHTTLFGAYDANHSCFVLMYLERDSHQLILQTSVRASNPSVRFKTTQFEASKWYHIAVTQRKNQADPSQSIASLFVDGIFAEQRRCNYPAMPEEQPLSSHHPATGQRHHVPVQAFIGTPRSVAMKPAPNQNRSRWSLGTAHLYSAPVSDEFITVQYRLGTRYRGNLQDCLGPLLTYQASAELNRYNETLHPDKSDRSDILAATEGRGGEVVAESRILLGVSPAAVIDFDACFGKTGGTKYELDSRALSRFQKLSQATRAVAINTATGSLNDSISHSYGAGIFTGDPLVVLPQPLDEASWCLTGSLPVLVRLLESATTKDSFVQSAKAFFDCIKDNWRISEAMEKGHGFGILAMIIREKLGFDTSSSYATSRKPSAMLNSEDRQTLPKQLLELILEFVGYDKEHPEDSLLVNPMAYRILLIDFDTWRRSDIETQKLYYTQFGHLVAGNKNAAFNQKRLTRMRIVKKLIDALKGEEISFEAAGLMMAALATLLETSGAQAFYRDLAMFVAYGLHDDRAMPTHSVRHMASTVSLRQKIGSWARGARGSRPSTPGGQPIQQSGISRFELAVLVLRLLAETLTNDQSGTAMRRFNKAVNQRWILHLLAETDSRVVELTLSILCKALTSLGPEFKASFVEKHGGFITLKSRLKPFSRSKSIWTLVFAIFFGRNVPLLETQQDFSAFHLVEALDVNDSLVVKNPEILPALFAMLESGVRRVSKDEEQNSEDHTMLKSVVQFLGELYSRSSAFRDFAVNSRYLQELLFLLFPLLTGSDRASAETELQSEALSFKGEEVKMRPHSNSLGERPPSVRSLTVGSGKRTPSPMAPNRVPAPRRISSFVLVNDDGERLKVPPAQFNAPMAPKAAEPIKINVTNSLVESLLELAVSLFIEQVCYKDKFNGIGLFLKVPPGFREHQAYFESYVLINALSQLGSHLRLNQQLLLETKVLTNLSRYAQHMAEAVSEGWFIDGAQPLLDFTGEILEHLQQPQIASVKSVRLCSQSTNAIRVVFLKATLWRLAELDEDADEKDVGNFLLKMTYWQTILFSAENQETLFTKLICFLLYHKLVSGVKSVRLAAAQLWRIVLVQKPTETATMLTNTMGPEQRHLSTGFMKLVSMDDDDFLAWVDQNRSTLDAVFHNSLSKPWDEFVQNENKNSDETAKARLSKRRDKLRQWNNEETIADDFTHRFEVTTNHWRANVHAQERLKLQRAVQDHQENINHLYTAFAKIEKLLHEPCGLEPAGGDPRWHLDETEAANRMRMRIVPEQNGLKETFQPKRKASRSVSSNNKLVVNTALPKLAADDVPSPIPPTPGTPAPAPTDGTSEQNGESRPRSDSVSGSQLLEGGFEMVDDPKEDEDGMIEDKNRKVLTSLQRGDMVQQLYNTSRIVGLEACEGLLVVGQKCIYMQDNFFQRSDGEIVSVAQAPEDERDPYVQLISGKDVGTTRTKHSIGDQETRHWTWKEVLSVSKRRFLLRDVAIEVFFTDGRSYLLTCMSSKVRDDLYSAVVYRAPHVHTTVGVASEDAWRLDTLRNPEEAPKNLGAKFGNLFNQGPSNTATKKWQRGEMSNFQYLMLVNTMAGRTFNDLTQYPVFPWVLADYTSEELDLDDPKSFRDFSKPMGCQTPAREAEYKDRYKQFAEMGDGNAPPFHYGTHYSSAMIVSSYLIRLQPFVQSYLLLQGGAFDHADRLFDSIEKAWLSASRDTMSDVRELTPEFFYLPEFLTNINKYDFGTKQVTGEAVNHVHLPKWAKGDPHIFITKHREALESRYVSDRLHDWIDLVFGFKQRGEMAIEATNVFQHLSYGGAKDLDKIDDQVERLATIGIIHSFGQTPHQVFQKPHVYREQQAEQKLDTLVETLTRLPDTAIHIGEKVSDFTYSPTKNQLLASGPCKLNVLPDCDRYLQWGFPDHSIRFFSKHTKRLLGLYENTHVGPVSTATFVDSKTLVTAGQDCTIGVWKVITSKDLIEIQPKTYLFGHRTAVTVLAASRVFSTLLSASVDGQVLIWGLNRQNCIRVLLPSGGPEITAARISNVSGHILLCRGKEALLYTLNGHLLVQQTLDEEILCAAFYEGSGGNEFLERELIFLGFRGGRVDVFSLQIVGREGNWELVIVKRMGNEVKGGGGITAVLPMSKGVYVGDEEGSVWSWECVVRGGRK